MNKNQKKIKMLFQSAKSMSRDTVRCDDEAPFGFSTRIVNLYLSKEQPSNRSWSWEGFVLKGAICAVVLSGITFWTMREDLDVYSEEYIEARMIETNIDQDIL